MRRSVKQVPNATLPQNEHYQPVYSFLALSLQKHNTNTVRFVPTCAPLQVQVDGAAPDIDDTILVYDHRQPSPMVPNTTHVCHVVATHRFLLTIHSTDDLGTAESDITQDVRSQSEQLSEVNSTE